MFDKGRRLSTVLALIAMALALWSLALNAKAHGDPIYCDPFTPLYDYKLCYAMRQFQDHTPAVPAPQYPNPPYYQH